jgi:hypothetical protein
MRTIEEFEKDDRVVLIHLGYIPTSMFPVVDSKYECVGSVYASTFSRVYVSWDNGEYHGYPPEELELADIYYANTTKLSISDPNRSFRLKKKHNIDR